MAKDWKKDLEKQIEAKTGTKDFANAAQEGALLQRIAELETAWQPFLEYLAYISQNYQAGEKVFKACFDADKAGNTINFYAGFIEPAKELGYLNADLAFTVLKEALNGASENDKMLMRPITDDNTLRVISWNGIGFRTENKKETFSTDEVDLLIKGINQYIAVKVANDGLQKRHVRKNIDLSPKP